MSDAKFGEPWSFAEWDDSKRHIFTRDGIAAYMLGCNKRKSRIVACVNAFSGVEDPEAELARLRKIEAAVRAYSASDSESGRRCWNQVQHALDDSDAALDAKGDG